MINRRNFAAGAAVLAAGGPALAQGAFPNRTITTIVPYPAGGSVDITARLFAEEMAKDFGIGSIVENKPGAAGVTGTLAAAKAAPDGYTLICSTNQTHATNDSLVKDIPYSTLDDFVGIAGIAGIPHALVVPVSSPAADVKQLIELLKAQPQRYNYGSSGQGSASHLAAELFKLKTATNLLHIPQRGVAPLVQELLGGRLDAAFVTVSNILPHVRNNALRALAIASDRRFDLLPGVPTLKELGIAGVEADAWIAYFAPSKTPEAAVSRLWAFFRARLNDPSFASKLKDQGLTITPRSPAEMRAFIPAEIEKWAAVVKAAGLKAS